MSGSALTAPLRRMRVLLGTTVVIEMQPCGAAESDAASAADACETERVLERAYAAVADVERRMHPRRAGSEVARINHARPGEAVAVSADLRALLVLAQQLHAATAGVFDPCLPQAPGGIADVELLPGGAVTSRLPLALDLGGLAKGHAIDRAIAALEAAGCRRGLVNAGGDLRVLGTPTEPVLLRHLDGRLTPIALRDAALAVSAVDAAGRPSEHRGHYVRGVSRAPARAHAAVIAPRAVLADALTKCLLLCAPEDGARVLRAFGAREAAP